MEILYSVEPWMNNIQYKRMGNYLEPLQIYKKINNNGLYGD